MPHIDYIYERERDFLKAYTHLPPHPGAHLGSREILRKVIAQKACRFYVSEEECYRNLLRMNKNLPLTIKSTSKLHMYAEIHRRVTHLLAQAPQTTLHDAICQVIYNEAPQFYISLRTAQRILKTHRQRNKKNP